MIIKQIEAKDTYSLRNNVLRSGKPIESCQFNGDNDEHTFHLGAYVEDKLVSIASFYLNKNSKIEDEYQFQLRGMATHPDFRGQGMSHNLLKTAFPLIKKNHVNKVWCNARLGAVGFYEKVGFIKADSVKFNIEDIGEHYLMHKEV